MLGEESMNSFQFIVYMIQAYASFLTAALWPVVVLVIFFTVIFFLDRSLGLFTRKKRVPVTWKSMENVLKQIQQEQIAHSSPGRINQRRQALVSQELQNAQQAILQKDEKQLMRSMLTLSLLAVHNDKDLAEIDNNGGEYPQAEILLPEDKPKFPPQNF